MIIQQPNDEQLSARLSWWSRDYDSHVRIFEGNMPEEIHWPEDWPDLSNEARAVERARRHMEFHKVLRGDYE